MKTLRAILLLALMGCGAGISAQNDHPEPDERGFYVLVRDPMPDFELTDLAGETYTRASLLGQVYVLQFTASWCGVCRAEMPHLEEEVWQGGKGTLVIGVDLDEPAEKVARFAEQTGVTYPMAPDAGGAVFGLVAAPKSGVTRNVVVDAEGRIAFLTRLFDTEEFEAMKSVLERLNP